MRNTSRTMGVVRGLPAGNMWAKEDNSMRKGLTSWRKSRFKTGVWWHPGKEKKPEREQDLQGWRSNPRGSGAFVPWTVQDYKPGTEPLPSVFQDSQLAPPRSYLDGKRNGNLERDFFPEMISQWSISNRITLLPSSRTCCVPFNNHYNYTWYLAPFFWFDYWNQTTKHSLKQ